MFSSATSRRNILRGAGSALALAGAGALAQTADTTYRKGAKSMKLIRIILPIAVAGVATILPAAGEVVLNQYQGKGYSFSYPSNWQLQQRGTAVSLTAPLSNVRMMIQLIGTGHRAQAACFEEYRAKVAGGILGFPASLESGTQPMVYGSWRGDTINGAGQADGVQLIVSATAIEANNQFYILQLVAPLSVSWDAHALLSAFGRSLKFENLPKPSPGSAGAGCADCLSIWMRSMDRITAATVKGMR
jgi:hypothetical protein